MRIHRIHSHITKHEEAKQDQVKKEQFDSLYKTPKADAADVIKEEIPPVLKPEHVPPKPVEIPPASAIPKETILPSKASPLLEQQIGTRWLLIAGVITVFVSGAFFLLYAYEHWTIGPLGRIIIIAAGGVAALIIGEITRRREYEIVAKGTTALGFAILYLADFTAYMKYELISTTPAFAIAILITIAAMIYAVCLDEILMAFLALLGGYLTPILVSTGENLPVHLFSYTLILSLGAIACAYFRKWPAVNLLAFAGTFALYTGWFEKFYRTVEIKSQMPVALIFLTIFFFVYLIMPMLYGMAKKIIARKQDVILILVNAIVVFYYFWQILYSNHRAALALTSVLLAIIHLAAMFIVMKRCTEDVNLRMVLLGVALFFLTIASPIYFKFRVLSMIWACQAVILALIGIKYKSSLTQLAGAVALILSFLNLLDQLPMHSEAFTFIINPVFGTWVFVAAASYVYHLLYRFSSMDKDAKELMAQLFFSFMGILLLTATLIEWYCNCKYNLLDCSLNMIAKGQMLIFAAVMLGFVIRPICPKGILIETCAILLAVAGSIAAIVTMATLHEGAFRIFVNRDFALLMLFLAGLIFYHIISRFSNDSSEFSKAVIGQSLYVAIVSLFFLALTAEWFFHCEYNLPVDSMHNILKGQTVIFALTLLLFVIRPVCPQGVACKVFAVFVAALGSAFTIVAFYRIYNDTFVIFANLPFLIALLFVTALAVSGILLYRCRESDPDSEAFAIFFGLSVVFVLWVLITEQIWFYFYCAEKFSAESLPNWKFLAYMYISVAWALYGAILMAVGFWRNIRLLRYIALALFALLLLKVFFFDTQNVKQVYRIAGFFATGLTLVAVSYLYQFFKKKGFFDSMLKTKPEPDVELDVAEKEILDD
jgi:uncharacterized membrane protein